MMLKKLVLLLISVLVVSSLVACSPAEEEVTEVAAQGIRIRKS